MTPDDHRARLLAEADTTTVHVAQALAWEAMAVPRADNPWHTPAALWAACDAGVRARFLEQAAPVVAGMREPWLPIETAPLDQAILLAVNGEVVPGFWRASEAPWPWVVLDRYEADSIDGFARTSPTHWQPLPQPPQPPAAPGVTPTLPTAASDAPRAADGVGGEVGA